MPTSSPVTVTFTERTSPRFSSIANVAAALVAGMGACALLGWIFGVEVMKTLIPGATVMLPNTAMLFIVCGIALRLLRRERERGSHWLRMGQLAAAFTTVIGALMFTERMTGWDLGIDLLLFADAIRPYPFLPPGLPATNSLLCFLLAGIALLTLDWEPARGRRPAQWMAIGGLSLAGLAIVGYLFGARGLYAFDRAGQMALFTAVGFFTLHGGILFARPEQGGIALLSGHNLGSSLARRLIGATVGVPVVLGWIWLRAREQSMVSREAGIAINTVMTIGVLTGLVLQAATALRASDAERESLLMRERSAREDAESARARAEEANRTKSKFLATVSHELRTPLNAVMGYTGLMLDGVSGPLSDAHRHQLGRISLSARHLLFLIDEILTLTRLDAGKETVVIERSSLARILHESVAIIEPIAGAKGLAIHAIPPTPDVIIATNAAKVRQILVNLLGNAVKFTEDGDVALTGRVVRGGDSGAASPLAGDVVCLSVRDTGIGIEPQDVERIFDPFWQVDQNATRRAEGIGLGLHVSRRLARLLDGDVTVESDVGKGSTFHVWLPLR